MRSFRIRVLSLTALAILLFPMLGVNGSISLADHLLPTGIVVPLQMNTSLSSETSYVGQQWSATVFEDVYDGNQLVIPRGSTVEGQVISVDRADRFNRSGTLGIDFLRITFPSGRSIENIDAMLTSLDPQIRAHIDEESRIEGRGSSFKRNVFFIGGGAGAGALIGALAGGGRGAGIGAGVGAIAGLIASALNKGHEVSVPAGTEFGMELLTPMNVPVVYGSGQSYPNYSTRTTTTTTTTISSRTVRLTRTDILNIQRALREKGYYKGPVNGVFTYSTRRALMSFQEDNDLSETGRLDTQTAELLGIEIAGVSYGGGNVVNNVVSIDPNGQPSFMGVGSTHRFIIWRDGNLWHVRTTTAGYEHNFDGRITANGGTIRSLSPVGLESNDFNNLSLDRSRRSLNFEFTTAGSMDGLDFYTNADSLTFDLKMDGRTTENNVYIGHNGSNPVSIPFTLPNE